MRFVDEAKVEITSGKGGHGCISFRREKCIPRGGPDGGDGGRGGDVILRGNSKLLSLYDFRLRRHYEAKNGLPGMGSDRYGKKAEDLILDLPVGTLVYEIEYDEHGEKTGMHLLTDLVRDGLEYIVCRGGRGGRGNIHFKTSTNRAPRIAELGFEGELKTVHLQLKILADIGFLGLPSAGKSTLLSKITAARPKIAAYHFTTLTPNLGVLRNHLEEQIILADIPGLIEGASAGKGLGYQFLRHVERTRFLLHILGADDIDVNDPFMGYDLLNEELELFSKKLAKKKQVLIINKMDLLSEEDMEIIQAKATEQGKIIYFISALEEKGLDNLLGIIWKEFEALASEIIELEDPVFIPAEREEIEEEEFGELWELGEDEEDED